MLGLPVELGEVIDEGLADTDKEELEEVLCEVVALIVTRDEGLELDVALVVADGEGGRFFKKLTSVSDNARLNIRISLNEPEKSSPEVLL